MQSFLEFLVSVINHYHINGLQLFCGSFEWFVSKMQNIFLLFSKALCQGLIVIIVYYFQIWNKKEPFIINSRVISSHMGLVYSVTPYFINGRVISSHMGPMYNKTPHSYSFNLA